MALDDQLEPLGGQVDQLGRPEQARAVAELEHPRHDRARVGVLGLEHRAVVGRVVGVGRRLDRAGVAVVALDQPVDARLESQIRAVPSGSPSCQSVRVAYQRWSKSSGREKSCSAFDEYDTLPRMRDSRKTRMSWRSCE